MDEIRDGFPPISPRLGARATVAPPAAPPAPVPTQVIILAPPPPAPVPVPPPPPPPTIVRVVNEAPPPTPQRFTLNSRNGRFWSYPYSYVGLIEMPSPELLIIHCNSREIEAIEITGRALDQIAKKLVVQGLTTITESDNVTFERAGACVKTITVRYADKKADEAKAPSAEEVSSD